MATKRTMAEVNKDYRICKKYVDEHADVTSIREISKATGLSESQVTTSLERHPRVHKEILKKIADNQSKLKAKKAEEEAKRKAELKAKKAEEKAKRKAEQEAKKTKAKAKRKAGTENEKVNEEAKCKNEQEAKKTEAVDFVIDASITGTDELSNMLDNICTTEHKIVLTSVTIYELEKMQKFHDRDGMDARRILTRAAGNLDNFECKLIDETLATPDDCIIKYCADNKEKVLLITSDKTMELKARMYGVKTRFIKQNKNGLDTRNIAAEKRVHSLYAARKVGDKLLLECQKNSLRSYMVISGEQEYNSGVVELNEGDDVYVSTDKHEFMTFAHYKIISMSAENNCNLVFSRRLYDAKDIENMPEQYQSFMREFIK